MKRAQNDERKRARPAADWRADPRQWEPHVDGYKHKRAVEASARKHGRDLGASFLWLLAARLTVVDVDRIGARPTPLQAWRTVRRWAVEGKGAAPCRG